MTTGILLAGLIAAVIACIRHLHKRRRQGKGCCGNCARCGGCGK